MLNTKYKLFFSNNVKNLLIKINLKFPEFFLHKLALINRNFVLKNLMVDKRRN